MISIALCDDDNIFLQYIKKLIYEYENEEFDIHTYTNPQNLIADIQKDKTYDLIFLDIEMPQFDGIEAGIEIKKILKQVIIVFISGYDRALDAFQLKALDYIAKPVKENKFYETLDRCLIEYEKNKQYQEKLLYYIYENHGQSFKISYKDILYFEKIKNKVLLYYEQNNKLHKICFYKSMKQVERELAMDNFFRCHVSYIVNINAIYYLKNRRIFIEPYNIEIEVSRNKIDKVKEIIKNKLFEGDIIGSNYN